MRFRTPVPFKPAPPAADQKKTSKTLFPISPGRSGALETFVARQPIFDGKLRVYGYELLFRSGAEILVCDADPAHASSKVIADSLMVLGFDTLTSGRLAFVNITRDILTGGHYTLLPPGNSYIEILEHIEPDDLVIKAIHRAREAGYRIALDDFRPGIGWEKHFNLIDMIKVDVLSLSEDEVRRLGNLHREGTPVMLAEKVENQDVLETVRESGYQFFQGFFFARPVTVSRRDIPASKLSMMRLLEQIHRPRLDLDAIEETIEHELALCYKLLRFMGSAYMGWRQPVTSVRHALMLMGQEEFKRWASIVALAGMADDKPEELVTESVLRGRYCQGLAKPTGLEQNATDLFLLGLFSLIDAILDQPLTEILDQMAIDDDLKRALLGGPGPLRSVLDLVLAHQRCDWNAVDVGASRLGISTHVLPPLFAEALQYSDQSSGMGDARAA